MFHQLKKFFQSHRLMNLRLLDEFEELLIESDVGVEMTESLMTALREKLNLKKELSFEDFKTVFFNLVYSNLKKLETKTIYQGKPTVFLMVGINGVGKTTTLAKLANLISRDQKSVMVVACDTFRAAAQEQLETWAQKIVSSPRMRGSIQFLGAKEGADPASVAFEAMGKAQKQNLDVVMIDTAGRLHTKTPLMEELQKIKRVVQKAPGVQLETWMVLDATTGQNALSQCQKFHEALTLTGLVFTKMDGTSKAGILFSLSKQFELPVPYLCIGERLEDIVPFSAQRYLDQFLKGSSVSETEKNQQHEKRQ
ncbi:MAG: signal recognition particle-docking protein FtsY [Deltaproteobacteria bacterium RIFCSPHIGHO2_02_FULL_40_11]|nr:MAG: signal recognition particle-docking protein FtsY [Deltaproteobacteria bacterium RIFCSPHIGHO2_02_FULL_40_11]